MSEAETGETFCLSPDVKTPITELDIDGDVRLFVKREDLAHREISGNKYWKLFYPINNYFASRPDDPLLITFGGAFSNHIAAVAAAGKLAGVKSLGIIRGEELENKWHQNATLAQAAKNGMQFRFVRRAEYRNKAGLAASLAQEFPIALIIPEGGTNELAVEGIKFMLGNETKSFEYLCCPVGTGGTIAGLSKFAGDDQKVLGFKVVADASLDEKIAHYSERSNVYLFEAHGRGYGKFDSTDIDFCKRFFDRHAIPIEPVYTGKMFRKLFELIDAKHFPAGSRILAFHTGGLRDHT